MESEKIRQMFLDAADLRSMGPFENRRAEVERRFAALEEEYLAEYAPSPAAKPETARPRADWKKAMEYLASVLRQLDESVPEYAAANRAVWEVVAPAVQKFYGENSDSENGKN